MRYDTGVVVENFSFVFQLNNSQGSITRQEMRAFKKVWAVFDVDGTGYLNRGSIVPFLSVRGYIDLGRPMKSLTCLFRLSAALRAFRSPHLSRRILNTTA